MKISIRKLDAVLLTACLIAFFFMTTGCTKETGVAASNMSSEAISSNTAAVVNDNQIFDASIAVFVDCANGGNGETVNMVGKLHYQFHLTQNGNNFVLKYHYNPQLLTGVGDVTGAQYQATGETQEVIKGSFTNGQFNDTYVNNFKIIGQGPSNNFLIHENLHITINADGTMTSFIDNFSADCK
jgi:hypothetical protein